jgi:hypothetical protein
VRYRVLPRLHVHLGNPAAAALPAPTSLHVVEDRRRKLGFPIREARVSALRELVKEAPAPVIAEALGFDYTTTTRQSSHAGVTWNRYPANRGP